MQTMDAPPSTPPHRPKGGELSVGRRIAIVVEAALAIPPGQVRIPKGALGPICERYGDNDFAVEHTGVRKRQREGTLEKVVEYDKEAFERAYAWMASSPSDDEDD